MLSIAAAPRAALDLVVLGPGGDRHRAERMAGDHRALSVADDGGQHRLEVLAEASERVVAVGGGPAAAVTAQVVGDKPASPPAQEPDHGRPERQLLSPAVDEKHYGLRRRRRTTSTCRSVPSAEPDRQHVAVERGGQTPVLGIARDRAQRAGAGARCRRPPRRRPPRAQRASGQPALRSGVSEAIAQEPYMPPGWG